MAELLAVQITLDGPTIQLLLFPAKDESGVSLYARTVNSSLADGWRIAPSAGGRKLVRIGTHQFYADSHAHALVTELLKSPRLRSIEAHRVPLLKEERRSIDANIKMPPSLIARCQEVFTNWA